MPNDVRKGYINKLTYSHDDLLDPYELISGWFDDPSVWPDLQFGDIYRLLLPIIESLLQTAKLCVTGKTESESVECASNHFQTRHYMKSYIIHTAFMHACIIIIYRLMKIVVLTTYSMHEEAPVWCFT